MTVSSKLKNRDLVHPFYGSRRPGSPCNHRGQAPYGAWPHGVRGVARCVMFGGAAFAKASTPHPTGRLPRQFLPAETLHTGTVAP